MATFVLVHGAWTGGWGYKKTARLMRAAGHTAQQRDGAALRTAPRSSMA